MNIETLQNLHGVRVLVHGDTTWLDVESPDEVVFKALEREYDLHPVHLEESVQKVQLTEIEREDTYLFLLLHTARYEKKKDKISAGQVGVFLGKDYLLTIHDSAPSPAQDMFSLCSRDSQARERYFHKGAGHVLSGLIRRILDDLSDLSESVLGELDAIEDKVFDDNGSDANQIGRLRQKIIRLKRIIGPKRSLLQDLATGINDFTGQALAKRYANNTKTANKLWEVVEEAQETIEIFKDADFTISTEKTNKTLAVLTLLFTLTIPATVIGAIYGMNITLPGGIETGSWTFLGPYTMFKLMTAASLLAALVMYAYFRRKKWF